MSWRLRDVGVAALVREHVAHMKAQAAWGETVVVKKAKPRPKPKPPPLPLPPAFGEPVKRRILRKPTEEAP